MKHTFDEPTMQAAIDAACEALGKGDFRPTAGLLDTVPGCHDWKEETSARLHLLKSALDFLPEPPPPVVDGKTPGQICHESMYNTPEWKWLLAGDKAACEAAASAVLAAFGNKSQLSTLRPLSEAGPVPAGCVRVYAHNTGDSLDGCKGWLYKEWIHEKDTHFADIRLPESEVEAPAEVADPFAELKAAHAAGKTIQLNCGLLSNPKWEDVPNPLFNSNPTFYRIKPEPETFTAHGKTWIRHTPGDPMPCDGDAMVEWILEDEMKGHQPFKDGWIKPAGNLESWANIAGWRYADEPTTSGKSTSDETTEESAPELKPLALGGWMQWSDLARQLADIWWKCHNVGASLQHGDLENDIAFSVVCEQHGGQCFHGTTPMEAWLKAEKWLMSPDRANFPSSTLIKD